MLAGQPIMTNQESDFVMVNLKVPEKLREEFKVAAKLEGMDLSGMLRQFMIRSVREIKERDPEAFRTELEKKNKKKALTDPQFENIPQTRLFSDGSGKPVTRKRISGPIKKDIEDATKDAIERTKNKLSRKK